MEIWDTSKPKCVVDPLASRKGDMSDGGDIGHQSCGVWIPNNIEELEKKGKREKFPRTLLNCRKFSY